MLDPLLASKALLLLFVANGSPVLGKRLLGSRLAVPLDGGHRFFDDRPLLGPSKTVRGLILSLTITAAAARLLGFTWNLGFGFAAASMAGDVVSSFFKRRLNIPASGRALGLDQVPEALLPLWIFRTSLCLDGWDLLTVVLLFTVGELLLSMLLFRLGIRGRPY